MTNPTIAAFDRLVAELRSTVETAMSEALEALRQISELQFSEADWPLDDAVEIARKVLRKHAPSFLPPAEGQPDPPSSGAADQYLQEIADGAWGDGLHMGGLARDALNRRTPKTRKWITCKVCGGVGKTVHKHAGSAYGLADEVRVCTACNGKGGGAGYEIG